MHFPLQTLNHDQIICFTSCIAKIHVSPNLDIQNVFWKLVPSPNLYENATNRVLGPLPVLVVEALVGHPQHIETKYTRR